MKKYILLFGLVFFTGGALFAQSEKVSSKKNGFVPAAVLQSFAKEFPDDKAKNWETEDNMYEVNFKHRRKKMSALFNMDGSLVQTEKRIKIRALPSAAIAYLNTYYLGMKIKEVSEVGYVNGVRNYEAEVNGKDLIFDVEGKFIQEKMENDKEINTQNL